MGKHPLFGDDVVEGDASDAAGDEELVAHVERYDRAPDECTIFPDEVAAADLMTVWISAKEGSYVSPVEMR